ncbi:MAG: A24 family peptidase C-terminal domain-containing protein [Natrialbaceae archaeon]
MVLSALSVAGVASLPDLLRLVALPAFAWAAVRDVKTRRVPGTVWIPLGALALCLFVWDALAARSAGGLAWTDGFLLPAALSLGLVVPIAYLFWWFGGFGGADAKALLVLALLFPVAPTYAVGSITFPVAGDAGIGAFALTILTNAVLVGVAIPVALAVRNAAAGRIAPVMFVGWPVRWDAVVRTHGRLLQTPDGLTTGGLDLDALRMYLRWRGLSLQEVRADPGRFRDPATLPDDPNPPTDGAITASGVLPDGGELQERDDGADGTAEPSAADATYDDPWGAEAFLDDIEGNAYGTTPDLLRDGLDVLAREETVWISPGTPFLVPVFVGLLVALVYGDVLVGLLF